MRVVQLVCVSAVAMLAIAGCKKVPVKPNAGSSDTTQSTGANTSGAGSGSQNQGTNLAGAEQAALAELQKLGMIIYFDYDKAEIKSEYVSVLAAHAKFLNANVNRKVRLEGHTDERGSREYNIGLGERRSQAVRRALLLQGVAEGQIATVSYGEERPAASGSDEEAYAKNRRVEMGYGR
jgi:peptidoglycan-associated lipoprotein